MIVSVTRTILQAAVGIAVALLRAHQGSLLRQATLSSAMVDSVSSPYGIDGKSRAASTRPVVKTDEEEQGVRGVVSSVTPAFRGGEDNDTVAQERGEGAASSTDYRSREADSAIASALPNAIETDSSAGAHLTGHAKTYGDRSRGSSNSDDVDVEKKTEKSRGGDGGGGDEFMTGEPLVADPWYQMVLARECMLHGFQRAAEAGLRRLRKGVGDGGSGAVGDSVWAWTEVLLKVSAAEAFYGDSTDQARTIVLFFNTLVLVPRSA